MDTLVRVGATVFFVMGLGLLAAYHQYRNSGVLVTALVYEVGSVFAFLLPTPWPLFAALLLTAFLSRRASRTRARTRLRPGIDAYLIPVGPGATGGATRGSVADIPASAPHRFGNVFPVRDPELPISP